MKLKKKWKQAALLLILTTVLTSCSTLTKTRENNLGDFPLPYDLEGNLVAILVDRTQESDQEIILLKVDQTNQEPKDPAVLLPLWYWKKIVRFAVDAKGVNYEK